MRQTNSESFLDIPFHLIEEGTESAILYISGVRFYPFLGIEIQLEAVLPVHAFVMLLEPVFDFFGGTSLRFLQVVDFIIKPLQFGNLALVSFSHLSAPLPNPVQELLTSYLVEPSFLGLI